MTTLDTVNGGLATSDNTQVSGNQVDKLDEILEDLIYDTQNTYGWPNDYEPDFNKAKQALQAHFLEIIEWAKPLTRNEKCCNRVVCINQTRIDTWNYAIDTYHTNLIKQVKGEK